MVEIKYTGSALWDRIERAVEKVNERQRENGLSTGASLL